MIYGGNKGKKRRIRKEEEASKRIKKKNVTRSTTAVSQGEQNPTPTPATLRPTSKSLGPPPPSGIADVTPSRDSSSPPGLHPSSAAHHCPTHRHRLCNPGSIGFPIHPRPTGEPPNRYHNTVTLGAARCSLPMQSPGGD